MSLGFFSSKKKFEAEKNVQTLQIVSDSNIVNKYGIEKKLYYVNILFSLLIIIGTFLIGIILLPSEVVINLENYSASFEVVSAIIRRFKRNISFTLFTWLMPIIPATFLPLYATEFILSFSAVIFSIIGLISILFYEQYNSFVDLWSNTPEMGYMWYEMLTIYICTFLTRYDCFIYVFLGPGVCVCSGPSIGNKNSILYVLIAIVSVILVLPTVEIFITNDEFFLEGFNTKSVYGTFLSLSMILVWIKTYHLICRDVYQIFIKFNSLPYKIFGMIWGIMGTAFVLLWVSGAFALHLAISSALYLPKEKSFFDFHMIKNVRKNLFSLNTNVVSFSN